MKQLVFLFLFAVPSAQVFCQSAEQKSNAKSELLNVADFDKRLSNTKNAQVIDVRTPEEYVGGQIAKAKNVDWYAKDFESQILTFDKTKPSFVYCKAGGRSAEAVAKMKALGFLEIYELQGGMMAWERENKGIVKVGLQEAASKGLSMEQYQKLVTSDKLVLIDFNAPWCGPCKKLAPVLESIGNSKKDKLIITKINVDNNKDLTNAMGIGNIPALFLYKNGKEVWKFIGLPSSDAIYDAIEKNE